MSRLTLHTKRFQDLTGRPCVATIDLVDSIPNVYQINVDIDHELAEPSQYPAYWGSTQGTRLSYSENHISRDEALAALPRAIRAYLLF
jgi:hypothetical protein